MEWKEIFFEKEIKKKYMYTNATISITKESKNWPDKQLCFKSEKEYNEYKNKSMMPFFKILLWR